MQKLFLGIYGAILASTLVVLALSYFALESFNQHRYQQHLERVMSGTLYLLDSGVARQTPQNQQRWIELASSLMDAELTLREVTPALKTQLSVTRIESQGNDSERYLATIQQAGSNQAVELGFDGLTEQIVTATAFFMLNELGRLPVEERQDAFDRLSARFDYELFRMRRTDLDADSRQIERLERGESIVLLKKQLGRGLALNVYAPWGNTSDVLALGPILLFDPYPPHITAIVLASTLLLMALAVLFIIRRVAKRLVNLQDKVDAINPDFMPTVQAHDAVDVISELNLKIQNMAQRIQKLLDEKAYMIRAVSHDLRTPIAKIHFRLESLGQSLGHENKILQGCHQDLRQLNLLIDELLTYEKLSVKQPIEIQPVNLIPLLQEHMEGLSVVLPSLNVEMNTNAGSECWVNGNEILLGRLMENLLHNAGRYAKSKVLVTLDVSNNQTSVVVEDDGEGLDPSALNKVFEPFFKADASRSDAHGGYGMGLAIVKQVAMQHSGRIFAENRQGGGAKFTFVLPMKGADDAH